MTTVRLSGFVHSRCETSGSYAAEIQALAVHTQGTSLREAKEMARDAVAGLLMDFTEDGEYPHIELLDNGESEFALLLDDTDALRAYALRNLSETALAAFDRDLDTSITKLILMKGRP